MGGKNMESVETQYIKRLCNFYVSDIHLSVILIPYISKEIDEDVEVTTIFEKNNKSEFEKVIDKLNIKNKKKILNINWIDKYIDDYIENIINNKKKNTIIIKGSKKFIFNTNNIIQEKINHNKSNDKSYLKVIDCYNVEEVKEEMKNIVIKYDGILNTLNCLDLVNSK